MKMFRGRTISPIYNVLMNIILGIIGILCVFPMLLVLSASFTDERALATYGYLLMPKKLSLFAYRYILSASNGIFQAYKVTIFVTVVGTLLSLLITALFAYPLSRKELKYRVQISFFAFFTMLFNGGLVPWYILISRYLHLKDNIFVLIIPYLVQAWNVLIMRNFFKTIPDSIIDSAKIDGSGEFRTFFRIIVPLSLPSFATIGLFNTLMYWNDWWLAILYIDKRSLFPLQYMLQSVLTNIEILMSSFLTRDKVLNVPGETARMALCILAIGPIILAYPFFQRYFIKGLTVGSVKG
jgi:ABC-type sugar transport system, permease component